MKSFKQLALAAAVLSTSFMAQAQMKSMEDAALSDVTGQAGISISGNFNQTIGSITYTDTDSTGDAGKLTMETITLTGFEIEDANPIKIDVENSKLQITMPRINGTLNVGAIKVGGSSAASIGSLAVTGMDMSATTIRIWGH